MADVIKKATNKFTKGLVMDFSPENSSNELLTHALNATLLTFNGNELSLQNDMGNARVETAFLPEGYIPVGTCEYGGIIYIVSYNPLEDKSQIGCFPSPERNISSEELGKSEVTISNSNFLGDDGTILNNTQYVLLKDDKLNPGDKFIISSEENIYKESLQDLLLKDENTGDFNPVENPVIALNVVSIEDSGKIVYLNSDVVQYEKTITLDDNSEATYKYHVLGEIQSGQNQLQATDIDSYRNVVCSGYSVFKSKISGKLAILAELIMIDSYSVTYSVKQKTYSNGDPITGSFDIVIHTDVSPNITASNYTQAPKLKYYHLSNSQGYIQLSDPTADPELLFQNDSDGNPTSKINSNFLKLKIPEINKSLTLNKALSDLGQFNFPKTGSYHGRMENYTGSVDPVPEEVYTKFSADKFHRISKDQVYPAGGGIFKDYYIDEIQARFYRYNASGSLTEVDKEKDEINTSIYTYYIKEFVYTYHDAKRDTMYNTAQLYKLTTEPVEAQIEQINDSTIMKWYERQSVCWRKATEAEVSAHEETLWYAIADGYESLLGSPVAGVTYYIQEKVTVLDSIGYTPNVKDYPNTIWYYTGDKHYEPVENTSQEYKDYWDFTQYPKESSSPYGYETLFYWQEVTETSRVATDVEILNYQDPDITLYYNTDYVYLKPSDVENYDPSTGQLFISVPYDTYASHDQFVPTSADNDINTLKEEDKTFPKQDPIELYTVADFIPKAPDYSYEDVTLANIKIPAVFSQEKVGFPFKYEYTLVPCMNYGKLAHLSLSNTIDFSKLDDFSASDFNIWKYHIDDNQLRLTFGAEIYDTFETNKVNALVLEFYDIWGFVGSIEINDKKSYSGVFTKLLSLNSYGALSKQKISGNTYTNMYKHNINITEDLENNVNKFGDKIVTFAGNDQGWSGLSDEDNDCGVLYSNILYGVQPYLRVNDGENYKFIPTKSQFFLYTLPIHNSQYYNCDNFNELQYPKLDLMLTYKLQDSSTKQVFDSSLTPSGYGENKELIDEYISGNSAESDISTVRYYKYAGTSNLYLEVGLKKEYADFNVNYDTAINNYFTCKLQLLGNEPGKSFAVSSGVEPNGTPEQILRYGSILTMDYNSFGFDVGTDHKTIEVGQLPQMNFLSSQGNSPLKINYGFIVGYKVDINNIKAQDVQTTTVSALFHKNNEGELNYHDFSIYYDESDATYPYKCDAVFYNGGNATDEWFGLCRQVNIASDTYYPTITEQYSAYVSVNTKATSKTSKGVLNSGNPMKTVMPSVGKYSFCLPHIHGLSDDNGINYGGDSETGHTGVLWPDLLQDDDVTCKTNGIAAGKTMHDWPQATMGVITPKTGKYFSSFYSTVQNKGTTTGYVKIAFKEESNQNIVYHYSGSDKIKNECNILAGMSGDSLANYNKYLLETMKSVYGYNADYDTYQFNLGKVNISDNKVAFTSSLISTYAKFKFGNKTLNDFIYFGGAQVTAYLLKMAKYSNSIINTFVKTSDGSQVSNPLVTFTPNYRYCGDQDQGVLISSLTYNTPVPYELEDELTFNTKNLTIVKHHDGSNIMIQGSPNKKMLYAWNQDEQHLVTLDVNTHTIDSTGKLTLNQFKKSIGWTVSMDNKYNETIFNSREYESCYYGYTPHRYQSGNRDQFYVAFTLGFGQCPQFVRCDNNRVVFKVKRGTELYLEPIIQKYKQTEYHCDVNKFQWSCKLVGAKVLKSDFPLETISDQDLMSAMYGGYHNSVNYNDSGVSSIKVTIDGQELKTNVLSTYTYNTAPFRSVVKLDYEGVPEENAYELICLELSSVICNGDVNPDQNTDRIFNLTKTSKWSYWSGNSKYIVNSEFQKCVFARTSVTINDLVFDGTDENHRLYLRDGCYTYNRPIRNQIFYRPIKSDHKYKADLYTHTQWDWETTANLNNLFLFDGPSFV